MNKNKSVAVYIQSNKNVLLYILNNYQTKWKRNNGIGRHPDE